MFHIILSINIDIFETMYFTTDTICALTSEVVKLQDKEFQEYFDLMYMFRIKCNIFSCML